MTFRADNAGTQRPEPVTRRRENHRRRKRRVWRRRFSFSSAAIGHVTRLRLLLLLLVSYSRHPMNMNWNRNDDLCWRRRRRFDPTLTFVARRIALTAIRSGSAMLLANVSASGVAAANRRSCCHLDSFPLRSPVLEPDLDLDFGQSKLVSDRRPFIQREVLLDVELSLEFSEL